MTDDNKGAVPLIITKEERDGNWQDFNVNGHGGLIRVVARMEDDNEDYPLGKAVEEFLLASNPVVSEDSKRAAPEVPEYRREDLKESLSQIGRFIANSMWADHAEVHKSYLKKWHAALNGAYYKGYTDRGLDDAEQEASRPAVVINDAEINEITQDALGKWPSFEAQSWACKVVHAVLASRPAVVSAEAVAWLIKSPKGHRPSLAHVSQMKPDLLPGWTATPLGAISPADQSVTREDAQLARMQNRFAGRATTPATADFDLPAESDQVAAQAPIHAGEAKAFSLEHTQRGFRIIKFQDRNNIACSLQASSLATESAIWFGCDEANPRALLPGIGWTPVEMPADYVADTRMHLTQDQVSDLLPILQHFAETGEVNIDAPSAIPAASDFDELTKRLISDQEGLPAKVANVLGGAIPGGDQGLSEFTDWFARNYPGPDTIIHDPLWHAPKIFSAATGAQHRAGASDAVHAATSYVKAGRLCEDGYFICEKGRDDRGQTLYVKATPGSKGEPT